MGTLFDCDPSILEALKNLVYETGQKEKAKESSYFFLVDNTLSIGPIGERDIISFLGENELPKGTKIRKSSETHFHPLEEDPFFGEKKMASKDLPPLPKKGAKAQEEISFENNFQENPGEGHLLQDDSLGENKKAFYFLRNGQKVGPHTQEEIHSLLKNCELLFTDFIGLDEEKTWKQVFKFREFDRRKFSRENLPNAPRKVQTQGVVSASLQKKKEIQKQDEEAVIGLASLERGGKKKRKFLEWERSSQKKKKSLLSTLSLQNIPTSVWWISISLLILSLVGGGLLSHFLQRKSQISEETAKGKNTSRPKFKSKFYRPKNQKRSPTPSSRTSRFRPPVKRSKKTLPTPVAPPPLEEVDDLENPFFGAPKQDFEDQGNLPEDELPLEEGIVKREPSSLEEEDEKEEKEEEGELEENGEEAEILFPEF